MVQMQLDRILISMSLPASALRRTEPKGDTDAPFVSNQVCCTYSSPSFPSYPVCNDGKNEEEKLMYPFDDMLTSFMCISRRTFSPWLAVCLMYAYRQM